ncbi:MAG: hypothetical protein B7733_13745 [Myxococcales bacterium FL481]|nr:MAG: hypothetical protein B7733_13745 [Myxococcales bacterium FL481]
MPSINWLEYPREVAWQAAIVVARMEGREDQTDDLGPGSIGFHAGRGVDYREGHEDQTEGLGPGRLTPFARRRGFEVHKANALALDARLSGSIGGYDTLPVETVSGTMTR